RSPHITKTDGADKGREPDSCLPCVAGELHAQQETSVGTSNIGANGIQVFSEALALGGVGSLAAAELIRSVRSQQRARLEAYLRAETRFPAGLQPHSVAHLLGHWLALLPPIKGVGVRE